MRSKKFLIISVVIFFLIINTSYFWEKEIGVLSIPILLLLGLIYLIFLIRFFFELYYAVKEKLRNKQRLYLLALLLVVLILVPVFPRGIIDFDTLEGEDLLIAQREGAANCTTTLKIKPGNKFKLLSVCFGIEEKKGTYRMKNDTIFFEKTEDDRMYEYGVLVLGDSAKQVYKDQNVIGKIRLYKTASDTRGYELYITKNELIK